MSSIVTTSWDVAELVRMRKAIEGLRGPGIDNRRGAITIRRLQESAQDPVDIPDVVFYGKVATSWVADQTYVELTPVNGEDDPTATGAPNGHALIQGNVTTPAAPGNLYAIVGDILPYIVIDPTTSPPTWMLLNAPTSKPGASDYMVKQMLSGVEVYDYVKAAP